MWHLTDVLWHWKAIEHLQRGVCVCVRMLPPSAPPVAQTWGRLVTESAVSSPHPAPALSVAKERSRKQERKNRAETCTLWCICDGNVRVQWRKKTHTKKQTQELLFFSPCADLWPVFLWKVSSCQQLSDHPGRNWTGSTWMWHGVNTVSLQSCWVTETV